MEKLEMVRFEKTEIQLYSQNDELMMDMEQLGEAVGFKSYDVFKKFLRENTDLLTEEFSFLKKVKNIENGVVKNREKRFFNEQGIYEVALLARTQKAKSFRKFARTLITKYHRNELIPLSSEEATLKIKKFETKIDEMMELVKERNTVIEEAEESGKKLIEIFKRAGNLVKDIEALKKDVRELKGDIFKVNLVVQDIFKLLERGELNE